MDTHPNPLMDNLLGKFLNADFDTLSWRAGDWLLAIISLGIGIWYGWTVWIVVGAIALFLAWLRPMTRLQRFVGGLLSRVHKRVNR